MGSDLDIAVERVDPIHVGDPAAAEDRRVPVRTASVQDRDGTQNELTIPPQLRADALSRTIVPSRFTVPAELKIPPPLVNSVGCPERARR
jgi:hypothetical protein